MSASVCKYGCLVVWSLAFKYINHNTTPHIIIINIYTNISINGTIPNNNTYAS